MKTIYCMIYIAAICLANFLVNAFGPIITPINAFLLIGLDLVIRDKLHEKIGIFKMICLIAIAGIISFSINPATDMIAIASVSAFSLAALTDATVYQSLIRKKWMIKSNASNVASSAVDSLIFPMVAFGAFMPGVVMAQFAAKVFGGAIWAWALRGVK